METATLSIDLGAMATNWRTLDKASAQRVQTAAVVKADAYGLGMAQAAYALAQAGARRFFVALTKEGVTLRRLLGPGPQINVLAGHMAGDTNMIRDAELTPMLNSVDQLLRHLETLPNCRFGIQLDSGMNRLGLEAEEWNSVASIVLQAKPEMLISTLACGDDPNHPMNERQLAQFHSMTAQTGIPRSLASTKGITLGAKYHFELTRPGIGLYGGVTFENALPVVTLSLPIIQTRLVEPGGAVGYMGAWAAQKESRIATVSGGYADGLLRTLSGRAKLWAGDTPCPLVGRVSMDVITVDITHLKETPSHLDIICRYQSLEVLADQAQTISYEILTSLGSRYPRLYQEVPE